MHSTFAPQTALQLTNTPAQTCVSLRANFNYGKQGLPDLPTRVRSRRRNNTKRSNICPAATAPGSDSSKRKTQTTTIMSPVLQKKDLFPSSYRPYDEKSLLSSTLTDSAALTTIISKGLRGIPSTLRRNGNNTSTSSSNSSSDTVLINGRRQNGSKKVTVIKKKLTRRNKAKETTASEMEKSSTSLAAEECEPLSHLFKSKTRELVERPRNSDTDDHDHTGAVNEFPSKPSIIVSSSPQENSTASANANVDVDNFDEDVENISNKEDEDNNRADGDCMINSVHLRNRPATATEKVRCTALPLLKQRLGYLWEKKMFTDVIFLVGRNRRKIEAHRVILASCSEVFQSLLYGEGKPLKSADDKYILYENDFSEPALEVFIKAMYTNEIPICLTLAMALEVFYATKKYAVIFLEDQVLEHIRQLLTVSNVFEALRFSTNAVELTYLAPICWRIIEDRTAEVLEYHFKNLEVHLFVRILERDRLSVDEVQLFQFAVRWAANLCKTSGMKVTGKNKRHFMEPLLKHFRFTTMNPTQFNEVVAPSRILEAREIQQIQSVFHKVADLKNIALPYKTTPRVSTANQLLRDQHPSSTTESGSRLGAPKNPHHISNMDGSGDGQQVHMIYSDSAVIAPALGSKVHHNGSSSKKSGGTSSTRLKNRRVPSSHSKAR